MDFVDKDHEVEFLLEVQEEDQTWRPATLYRSRVQGYCGVTKVNRWVVQLH